MCALGKNEQQESKPDGATTLANQTRRDEVAEPALVCTFAPRGRAAALAHHELVRDARAVAPRGLVLELVEQQRRRGATDGAARLADGGERRGERRRARGVIATRHPHVAPDVPHPP